MMADPTVRETRPMLPLQVQGKLNSCMQPPQTEEEERQNITEEIGALVVQWMNIFLEAPRAFLDLQDAAGCISFGRYQTAELAAVAHRIREDLIEIGAKPRTI